MEVERAKVVKRFMQPRIVAELDALQVEVDALKRLQAETAAELDALLPAILQSSLGFDPTGNRSRKAEF
jgi:hypothetical protein